MGVKIVIHGNPAPPTHSVLILCNHRTRLDWLFLISYQLRCGTLSNYRISLKRALKNIPGPGQFCVHWYFKIIVDKQITERQTCDRKVKWWYNFLHQGQLSVLTLVWVSVPLPCYHSCINCNSILYSY